MLFWTIIRTISIRTKCENRRLNSNDFIHNSIRNTWVESHKFQKKNSTFLTGGNKLFVHGENWFSVEKTEWVVSQKILQKGTWCNTQCNVPSPCFLTLTTISPAAILLRLPPGTSAAVAADTSSSHWGTAAGDLPLASCTSTPICKEQSWQNVRFVF